MLVNWWKTTRRSPRISGTVKFSSLITTTANTTVHPFETKLQLSHHINSTLQRFPLFNVDGWSPSIFTRSDQLFMTLINLKLNSLFLDLAERFCTSKATVHIKISNIFALHEVFFEGMIESYIPSLIKCKSSMPSSFGDFNCCGLLINAPKVTHDVPGQDMTVRSQTFSS